MTLLRVLHTTVEHGEVRAGHLVHPGRSRVDLEGGIHERQLEVSLPLRSILIVPTSKLKCREKQCNALGSVIGREDEGQAGDDESNNTNGNGNEAAANGIAMTTARVIVYSMGMRAA